MKGMNPAKQDIGQRSDIERLVTAFYTKAREDETIGVNVRQRVLAGNGEVGAFGQFFHLVVHNEVDGRLYGFFLFYRKVAFFHFCSRNIVFCLRLVP